MRDDEPHLLISPALRGGMALARLSRSSPAASAPRSVRMASRIVSVSRPASTASSDTPRIVPVVASRSETSRSAILEATVELLEETTVQKLSIEAIAKQAGVGKTTIYRWWPSKAAVVIDAFMEHHLVHTPIPKGVPVREALRVHLRSLIKQYRGPSGALVAQIVAESQYDKQTLAHFRKRFWDGRRDAVKTLIERGQAEGEIRPDIDAELLGEMLYSPVYQRLLLGHRPLSARYVDEALRVAFEGAAVRTTDVS
ncbi:MAG TPA: TetR/AcrR family transcriptional regulator [Baekduia sp.]|nr:TetR/AcrR family transcriptional regulator [Baekduia sp.]